MHFSQALAVTFVGLSATIRVHGTPIEVASKSAILRRAETHPITDCNANEQRAIQRALQDVAILSNVAYGLLAEGNDWKNNKGYIADECV